MKNSNVCILYFDRVCGTRMDYWRHHVTPLICFVATTNGRVPLIFRKHIKYGDADNFKSKHNISSGSFSSEYYRSKRIFFRRYWLCSEWVWLYVLTIPQNVPLFNGRRASTQLLLRVSLFIDYLLGIYGIYVLFECLVGIDGLWWQFRANERDTFRTIGFLFRFKHFFFRFFFWSSFDVDRFELCWCMINRHLRIFRFFNSKAIK